MSFATVSATCQKLNPRAVGASENAYPGIDGQTT